MTYRTPTRDQRRAVESFRSFLHAKISPVAREYADRPILPEKMRDIT